MSVKKKKLVFILFIEIHYCLRYNFFYRDVTWSLQPYGGPNNTTVQRVFCRCRPGGVPYLLRRDLAKTEKGNYAPFAPVFYFGCSPQSVSLSQRTTFSNLNRNISRSPSSVQQQGYKISKNGSGVFCGTLRKEHFLWGHKDKASSFLNNLGQIWIFSIN